MEVRLVSNPQEPESISVEVLINPMDTDILKLLDYITSKFVVLSQFDDGKYIKRGYISVLQIEDETDLGYSLISVPKSIGDMSLEPAILKLEIKATVAPEDKKKIKYIAYKVLAEYSKDLFNEFEAKCEAAGLPGFKKIKIENLSTLQSF